MILNDRIGILEEFLRDFKTGLTGSYIANKKNMNQKTVANYLNRLEQEHILKSKIQGKNKLYFLNFDNMEIIKHFILAIEHLRTIKFYKKNILIKEVSEKIQPFIEGCAVIFGSYAKGTEKRGSDIDILIIGKCNEKEIDNISDMYRIEINLKIYPIMKKDLLTKEVIKNHVIIKNTERFIEGIIDGQD